MSIVSRLPFLASNYLGFPQPFSSLISSSRAKAPKSPFHPPSGPLPVSWLSEPPAAAMSSRASVAATSSKRFTLGPLSLTRRASAPLLSKEVRELLNDDETWSTDDDDIFPHRPRLSLSAHHRTYSEPVTSLTRAVTQSNFLRKAVASRTQTEPLPNSLSAAAATPSPPALTASPALPGIPTAPGVPKTTPIPTPNPTRPRPQAPQRSKTQPLRTSPRHSAPSALSSSTSLVPSAPPVAPSIPLIVITHSPASPPTLSSPTATSTSFTPLQDSRFGKLLTVPGHPAVNSTHPPLSAGGCYFPDGKYDSKLGHWLTVLPGIEEQVRNGWRSEATGIREEICMHGLKIDLNESYTSRHPATRASSSFDDQASVSSTSSFGISQECSSPETIESAASSLWANQATHDNTKSTSDTPSVSHSPHTPSHSLPPTPPLSVSLSTGKTLTTELSRRRHDSGRRRPASARRSDSFVIAVKQREQAQPQTIQLHIQQPQLQSPPRLQPKSRQSSQERVDLQQRYSQQLQQQQQSQARPISRRSTLSYSVHTPLNSSAYNQITRSRHISVPSPLSMAVTRPLWQECDITESLLVSRLVPALSS